jgi:peptide subunit release factor 1 (eRF1)
MTKIAVGSDVEAYCTKCKMVLAHTVIAMQGLKPRRVKCNTCNGEHNFRAAKPLAKAAKKPEKTKSATSRKTRQSWEEAMQEASSKPHKTYSMSGSFGEGDWIEHKSFGLGCVQSFVPPNKITVRFADSTRMLVCNQT